AVVADPAGYDESLRDGELADRARIAERADVDWLLDPALLDAPPLAERPEEGDQDGEPADTQPLGYSTSEEAARYASELGGGVGDRTVLALPYSSADLASLREADARGLEDIAEGRATSAFTSEGITPSGRAAVLPGAEADPDAVEARLATEPDVLLTPSTSLRPDPRGTITPSSVGVIEDSSGSTVVLAPDAPLSAELSALDADADVELVRQRVLAETAVIASEFTPTTRQILLMPDATADLDPEAVGAVLDALESAPWVETRSTADLLDAAASQSWTTNPQDQDDEALFALGRIDPASVQPSALDDEGYMTHLAEAERPAPLSPSMLQRLDDSISRAESLRGAMEDPAQVAGPEVLGLSATSIHWRDRPDEVTRRADAANTAIADLDEAISLSTSASFNLVANASEVPVTVSNQLDSRVTLELRASTDSHIVRVPEETITVEVPARSQTEALVPVEAIANGQVQLTVSVHGPDGVELAAPRDVELSVNPAWENWTTLVIVIAMGLLVVIGVLRARRHTSDRRAPAVRGPENTQAPTRTPHDSSDRTDPDPR
ncbi:MAG: DUF6049 family protein, partial [Brachybacterium sp.]|nr:DUF6049 family protein [Brachybacterium sp.]